MGTRLNSLRSVTPYMCRSLMGTSIKSERLIRANQFIWVRWISMHQMLPILRMHKSAKPGKDDGLGSTELLSLFQNSYRCKDPAMRVCILCRDVRWICEP